MQNTGQDASEGQGHKLVGEDKFYEICGYNAGILQEG